MIQRYKQFPYTPSHIVNVRLQEKRWRFLGTIHIKQFKLEESSPNSVLVTLCSVAEAEEENIYNPIDLYVYVYEKYQNI